MATLINGNLNNPVYASQDADLLAAICGNKTVVTPVGSQFAEELEDANTIKVDDGVIITKEGRRIQLDNGDIDEFLIPTGTQGQTQYYICGYHLYTDEESAELCETFVEAVSSGTDVIDEDTFRDGSTEVYVSLLRVKQEGVNITAITRLLPSGTDMNQINVGLSDKASQSDLSDVSTEVTELINQLPVKKNDKHFYHNNGLDVVTANGSQSAEIACSNIYVNGNYIKPSTQLMVTNAASNAWLPVIASDLKINNSVSVKDRLSYTFGNLTLSSGLTATNRCYAFKMGLIGVIAFDVTANDFTLDNGVVIGNIGNKPQVPSIATGVSWNNGVGTQNLIISIGTDGSIIVESPTRHVCDRITFNIVYLCS